MSSTRSASPARRWSAAWAKADLGKLKLSAEVAEYLKDRGYKPPTCPPHVKTPEPERVRGSRFNYARVDRVIAACRKVSHTEGPLGGQPFEPDVWQVAYFLAPVFGWEARSKDTGEWARIFTTAWVEVPRKNGKTLLAAAIALYLTGGDREHGAQVVCAATTREQARFAFNPMLNVLRGSPSLRRHFTAYQGKIIHPLSSSRFEPVANVGDAQHGRNLHGAIIDEVHLHKHNELIEALETGTGSRIQPLVLFITTADSGRRHTPYDLKRSHIDRVASGALKDHTTYGVVFAATKKDDPFIESTWRKANPGYGKSPTKRYMHTQARAAKNSPVDLATFQRLHLGLRTKQETKYLELAAWDNNASIVDLSKLKGRVCYGGLDLGSTSDLTALAWVFPDGDAFDILVRCWTPEDSVRYLDDRTARAASTWVTQGWLTTTPGNVTDYDWIKHQIGLDREQYDVKEIAFDRWNSTQLVNDLMSEGAPMEKMGQGTISMSAPTRDLQRLILLGTPENPIIRHGGNPLLRWMVDNFAIDTGPTGNIKPDKAKAGDKIDGVVALIMALSRATAAREAEKTSPYDDPDYQMLVV